MIEQQVSKEQLDNVCIDCWNTIKDRGVVDCAGGCVIKVLRAHLISPELNADCKIEEENNV